MEISRELFDLQRRPRFGNANPERMQMAFWEWMLKSGHGAYHARDLFKVSLSRDDGPIWTFDRMGATRTVLPDGREICVGGEHEDYYDPDFCIYNDVVVFGAAGQIEIYGYPKEVFPPTDFHTATLVNDRLFILGCLGYIDARRPGRTAVYVLELSGYSISEMQTSGEVPGWIHKHIADFDPQGFITIRGGEIVKQRDGEQLYQRNFEDYSLDVISGVWRRLTNRNWRQFSIHREDRSPFVLKQRPVAEALVPKGATRLGVPTEDRAFVRIAIDGVPMSLTVRIMQIELVVEGDLPAETLTCTLEEIRSNAQAVIHQTCLIVEY